jgi:CDP-glucose 4,6-dehydratase
VAIGQGALEGLGMTNFWAGRRVFITGHTGFKGAWLCLWLERMGAEVHGAALAAEPGSLHQLVAPWPGQHHTTLDIRDRDQLTTALQAARPEIVIHMAAQALVRRSYADPVETFAANVMGTVNLLEAVRASGTVSAVLVVTSDKVYENHGEGRPFSELDPLGGKDPYSNSKACAELVCRSYRDSFMAKEGILVATARAGNVIGGGDWAEGRLVPDFMRAVGDGRSISLRYPDAVRPWQHVLEPLSGYVAMAEALATRQGGLPEAMNFGPDPDSFATVADVVDALSAACGVARGWEMAPGAHPPEAATLTLTSQLAAASLGWRPRLDLGETIEWTSAWYAAHRAGRDMRSFTLDQIARYEALAPTSALVSVHARMAMAG